jgi:hypothetical protein
LRPNSWPWRSGICTAHGPSSRVLVDPSKAWLHPRAGSRVDEVEAAEEVARQATQAWGSARQRTAMLERLDERHLALWRAELDRSEAVERDDLTTGRQTREGGPR